jgi:hypothetical protein
MRRTAADTTPIFANLLGKQNFLGALNGPENTIIVKSSFFTLTPYWKLTTL